MVAALALAACGKGKDKDDKAGGSAGGSAAAATGPAGGGSAAAGSAAAAAGPSAEEVCAKAFAPADVGKIVGVEGLALPSFHRDMPGGMAHCKVEKLNENKVPTAMALAMIDCRGMSMDVARHRQMAKAIAGKDGVYREIDLGKGGAYSEAKVMGESTYSVVFVHESVPCSATVSTSFIKADHVMDLARWVHDRMTEGAYPR